MSHGEFGFALNEINLGMILPPGLIRMATHAVGTRNSRDLVLGKPVTPALEIGLAAEVVKPEAVLDRALALAREMAAKPPSTFGAIKPIFLETTGHHPSGNDRESLGQFIDHWFSPAATRCKDALIESMRR